MISLLIAAVLRRQGWEVAAARDVATTVAMARTAPIADIMLLDMHYPDGTAEDVLRQLSAFPHLSTVPVVLMTGATQGDLLGALQSPAVVAVLSKPVGSEELVQAVWRVLRGASVEQGSR